MSVSQSEFLLDCSGGSRLEHASLVQLVEFAVAAEALLVQVDVGHKPALVHPVDAVGDLHLIDAADLVEHDFGVLDSVLVEQLLGLGAVWAEARAENRRLLLTNYFCQALGVGGLAHRGEQLGEDGGRRIDGCVCRWLLHFFSLALRQDSVHWRVRHYWLIS